MRATSMFCTAIAVAMLSGCSSLTRTPYEPPTVVLPEQFEHASADGAAVSPAAWWKEFGEPQLDAWVQLALARNLDRAAAAIRVRRASLQAQLANNALWPTSSATMTTGVTRPMSGVVRHPSQHAGGNLGVTWEADLFGRLSSERDAARFEAEATREDLDAVTLSMIGVTANLYFQLAFANERIAQARETLAYAQRVREIVALRYGSGAVSRLEQREADQTVAQQQTSLSQLLQARVDVREALIVLFDGAPPSGPEPQHVPLISLPGIVAGIPAQVLSQRPDLRAAELRLRATLSSGDAVTARYYPSLSLTGALGTTSDALLRVLANPVATLGASLALPFLNAREMQLNTAIARARYDEGVVGFRKTMYSALAAVERALSARAELTSQQVSQQAARDEAREIERLYEMRYRAGQVALRAWLDAQERLRISESALASTRFALLQNRVAIHQALGGGFSTLSDGLS